MTTPGNDPFMTPPPPGQGGPSSTPSSPVPGSHGYGSPAGPVPGSTGAPQYGAPQPYTTPGAPQPYGAPGAQPYGAQQYGPAGWQQPGTPAIRKTRGAKILTFVGVGLGVVALALLVTGFSRIAAAVAGGPSEIAQTIVSVPSPGMADADLTAGDTYEIWASQSTTFSPSVTDVLVVAPSGAEIPLTGATEAPDMSDLGFELLGRFTPTESGTHTLSVGEGADEVTLVPAGAFDDILEGLTGAGGMLVGGFLLGGLSFFLVVGGAIWWAVAASSNRKARAFGAGYPTP